MGGEVREVLKCRDSVSYFADTYCRIYDAVERDWIPFRLWPEQYGVLRAFEEHSWVMVLKARQLGLTWLALVYALWQMVFHPIATVLVFSKRDDEASYLLGRAKGVYERLPVWLRARGVVKDNDHTFELTNGSVMTAFPTTAGDSYTATLVIVDEADLIPDLRRLLASAKPTIDGGGKLLLVSRSDKGEPLSEFKRMFREAVKGETGWRAMFLPWDVHPGRDEGWYERQKRDVLARTGSLDDLHEQYPATVEEALAPRAFDKRIPSAWLMQCYEPMGYEVGAHGLRVYRVPERRRRYVVGVDPAEGNPTSDDSAFTVLEYGSGEEVACFAGRVQPKPFAYQVWEAAKLYNNAGVLVERNNHGHAVLAVLSELPVNVLKSWDDKPGWHSTTRGKALMYATCADAFREKGTILHDEDALQQLTAIEGSTLRAPAGMHDDRATGYALALVACSLGTLAPLGEVAVMIRRN